MGDVADMILDGILDEQTGEFLGEGVGYPRTRQKGHYNTTSKRTPAEKKIASIRREISIMVKSGVDLQEARKQMNIKYGKGWRERGLCGDVDDQWSEEDLKPYTK
jgi:hypothetical protein